MSNRIMSPFGTVVLSKNHYETADEHAYREARLDGPARNPRVPPLDIYELHDAIIVYCDLPGTDKDSIDVQYYDDTLTITAEALGIEREDGRWLHHERRIGRYVRSVSLGRVVDPNKIKAKYENGVLILTIAKPNEQKTEAFSVSIE